MTRYALNLPVDLKREAEEMAKKQGISLNQFIMWSVAEKVTSMRNDLDDPRFPMITYRKGGSGVSRPVIRGTAIHVQTIVQSIELGETPKSIAKDYNLDFKQVQEAQAFYKIHKKEIDDWIKEEEYLEKEYIEKRKKIKGKKHDKAKTSS